MNTRAAHSGIGHQVASSESRWPLCRAISLWVFLSLVLWGLIIGGIDILL